MKRFIPFALLATALAVLALPREAISADRSAAYTLSTSARPALAVVDVGAYDKLGFNPKSLTVIPGTIVRWVNYGKEGHTVTSDDGYFDSGPLAPGATFYVLFYKPGTYHYTCRPRGKMGMVGTVIVRPDVPGTSGY
jgi:plastocyanin